MAKLTVEYDTVTKTAAVALDGTPVDNLHELMLVREWCEDEAAPPRHRMEMRQSAKDKAAGLSTLHVTFAADGSAVTRPAFDPSAFAADLAEAWKRFVNRE